MWMRDARGHRILSSLLLVSLVLVGAPRETRAQSASGAIEEIVVTARKREESLQNVPVAVAVVGGDLLRNNLASDLSKVGELAPQVSMSQSGSGTGAVITVRGVSSGSNDAGLDQSVAIEVDGVPISRGQIVGASVFDLQQVQVLQGPQALFFGKNSPAGVISLTSANPTGEFEAYVTPGYEFEADQAYVEGAVSGPLTDTLKARVAFRGSEMQGWLDNVAQPVSDIVNPAVTDPGATMGRSGPDDKIRAGRITLLWTPSEDFDANLKVQLNSQERNAGNASSEPFCINGQTTPVIRATTPIPGGDCAKNRVKSHGSVAPEYAVNFPYGNGGVPYFDSKFTLTSLNLNWRLNAFMLTSTTGYYDQTVQQMSVSDWSTFATIWAASAETYELLTEELRTTTDFDGPVNFMFGVYYEDFDRPFFNSADLSHTLNPAAGNYATVSMDSKASGNYFSVFAQVSWKILPELELAGGARYSEDRKDMRIANVAVGPGALGATLLPVGQVLNSRYQDENVSPEVTLTWRPLHNQTLYGAYKTGYKAGGISNPFLVPRTATPQNIRFQPEEAQGYEIGYKATLLERTLRFDLIGYSYDYDDLQIVSYNAQTISFSINNAAAAKIEGIQGTFEWAMLDQLALRGSVGYNQAEYQSYANAQCYPGQTVALGCSGTPAVQDLGGKALLRAPELTYSIGADYSPRWVAGWDTTISLQGSYTDDYQAASDYAPGGFQESFWLLNAGLRVGPDSGAYEIAVLGRNLTDEYYTLNVNGWSGAGNPNQFVGFFNRPREVAVQATVRF